VIENLTGYPSPRARPQRRVKPPFFLVPSVVFGLQLFLDGLHLGAQRGLSLPVSLLRLVQKRLRPVDGLLPAFALLLPCGLLPCLLAFAALPLPFVCLRGLSVRRLVWTGGSLLCLSACRLRGGLLRSVLAEVLRQYGMFAEGAIGSHGALEDHAPGFAIVAAMTSGSVLSVAAPWWKRLLSAPHASRAAFIEGSGDRLLEEAQGRLVGLQLPRHRPYRALNSVRLQAVESL
jgi:hypothetical protein